MSYHKQEIRDHQSYLASLRILTDRIKRGCLDVHDDRDIGRLTIIIGHLNLRFKCRACFNTPALLDEEHAFLNEYRLNVFSEHVSCFADWRLFVSSDDGSDGSIINSPLVWLAQVYENRRYSLIQRSLARTVYQVNTDLRLCAATAKLCFDGKLLPR